MWLLKRGKIWRAEFDPASSNEIRKTRPAVIIRNDTASRNTTWVVILPLTGNTGRQRPCEALVTVTDKLGKTVAGQVMAAERARPRSQHDT